MTSLNHLPLASEVSTTLGTSASAAFEAFSDPVAAPRWMANLLDARVVERSADGRPAIVSFVRRLVDSGDVITYSLQYRYQRDGFHVAFASAPDSPRVLSGEARFVPLSNRACLMHYRLVLDIPVVDLERHPASQIVSEFREYLRSTWLPTE